MGVVIPLGRIVGPATPPDPAAAKEKAAAALADAGDFLLLARPGSARAFACISDCAPDQRPAVIAGLRGALAFLEAMEALK